MNFPMMYRHELFEEMPVIIKELLDKDTKLTGDIESFNNDLLKENSGISFTSDYFEDISNFASVYIDKNAFTHICNKLSSKYFLSTKQVSIEYSKDGFKELYYCALDTCNSNILNINDYKYKKSTILFIVVTKLIEQCFKKADNYYDCEITEDKVNKGLWFSISDGVGYYATKQEYYKYLSFIKYYVNKNDSLNYTTSKALFNEILHDYCDKIRVQEINMDFFKYILSIKPDMGKYYYNEQPYIEVKDDEKYSTYISPTYDTLSTKVKKDLYSSNIQEICNKFTKRIIFNKGNTFYSQLISINLKVYEDLRDDDYIPKSGFEKLSYECEPYEAGFIESIDKQFSRFGYDENVVRQFKYLCSIIEDKFIATNLSKAKNLKQVIEIQLYFFIEYLSLSIAKEKWNSFYSNTDLYLDETNELAFSFYALDIQKQSTSLKQMYSNFSQECNRHLETLNDEKGLNELKSLLDIETCTVPNKYLNIEDIDLMSGFEFESTLASLFKSLAYIVKLTPKTQDQGADLIVEKDLIKYAVQAKNYSSKVGNKAVQEVIAASSYYDCSRSIVVTNNYFTNQAKELAKSSKVTLWDRDMLVNLLDIAHLEK